MQSLQRGFVTQALLTIFLGVVFVVAMYKAFISAPAKFPAPYHIVVTSGETVPNIAVEMQHDGVIHSARVFEIFMHVFGGDTRISEGEYVFDQPLSTLDIALRFSGKNFGINRTKVTFPEGFTTGQMSDHLKEVFPSFDTATFLMLTKDDQGKLFPDTYGFYPTPTPQEVIATMQQTYERKVAPLRSTIAQSGHSEEQIIIMASIIEKEAHGDNDRGIISGILWKRINDGIRLQVDAAPITYQKAGLPPAPISNPGLAAITAALNPVASPYLYYLHDSSGGIHYASTFSQHEQNIQKFLK